MIDNNIYTTYRFIVVAAADAVSIVMMMMMMMMTAGCSQRVAKATPNPR